MWEDEDTFDEEQPEDYDELNFGDDSVAFYDDELLMD